MSSSDSDYDCYGGAAELLDRLKSQFVCDTPVINKAERAIIQSNVVSLLDENSAAGSDVVQKENVIPIAEVSETVVIRENETLEEIQQSFQLPDYVLENGLPRRGRRKKKSPTVAERGRSNASGQIPENATQRNTRSRGRGMRVARGARGAGRGRRAAYGGSYCETFLIGERDDYVDHSASSKLFEKFNQPNNVNSSINLSGSDNENDEVDESVLNPLMSVKVRWRSNSFEKFPIRKFQKITSIFEHFSKSDNVKWENLYFEYKDKLLKPCDTPDSIGYNICKFIEGGVVSHNVFEMTKYKPLAKQSLEDKGDSSKLNLKFQVMNRKHPLYMKLKPNEKFLVAMVKVAEELGVSTSDLKFIFDGDELDSQSSPDQLEFEGGEIVDVIISV